MPFSIVRRLQKSPRLQAFAQWYLARGWPVPAVIRLRLANEFHSELIIRMMDVIRSRGMLRRADVLAVARGLGAEMGPGVARLLRVETDNALDLARVIDFGHAILEISGRQAERVGPDKVITTWSRCALAGKLAGHPAGDEYCNIHHAASQGAIAALNPRAQVDDLVLTQALGCSSCEMVASIRRAPGESVARRA